MEEFEKQWTQMKGFCDTNSNIKNGKISFGKMKEFEKMKGFHLHKVNFEQKWK